MKSTRDKSITVLGAGIQGICVALALSQKGYQVNLIDKMSGAMLRSSLRNEGKIHLGFIYANDKSLKTGRLMMKSALAFDTLLESWIPFAIYWHSIKSKAFNYLIMRDSMLETDALCSYFDILKEDYLNEYRLAVNLIFRGIHVAVKDGHPH